MLGVLSSTDLLTGTLDLVSGLPELAQETGEFFTEACLSLGKDPILVNWGEGVGREKNKRSWKKPKRIASSIYMTTSTNIYTFKIHVKKPNQPHIDVVKKKCCKCRKTVPGI